jgi:hypothetical protein
MNLTSFKASRPYQAYLRPVVWAWVMPWVRAAVRARWLYCNLKNEVPFRALADKDRPLLHNARSKNEYLNGGEEDLLGSVTLFAAPVGPIAHSTILYRSYLKLFKSETRCLDFGLNGDAFIMRRMFNAGVRAGFVNQVVTLQPLRPGQVGREAAHPVE